MKNIVLLTDFSDNSINAIHYALHLFQKNNCNFFVLHVQESSSFISNELIMAGNQSIYSSIIKKSKQKLTTLIAELESKFINNNYNFNMLIDYDLLPDAINQLKETKDIDLIVMGTNGVTGAKEVVFGSNTINVIRKVMCPTLVIPEGFVYRSPKEILLPLDLFDSLNDKSFLELLKFTDPFRKKLHVLRINPNNKNQQEGEKDKAHLASHLKETDVEYHTINNVPMQYCVSCYTQTHNIDLTALIVQKETLFERFFIGSSTTKISNKVSEPLFVFHSI